MSPVVGRVLVIEDDALNRELLQTVLEGAGFEVLEAADARDGLARARSHQPDIVLMDVQLPEMDGLQATRSLHEDPETAHIPVIAVTAHVKKDDERRCLEAGCSLHVPKPVDTRTLPGIVSRVIAESARRGQADGQREVS